MNNMYGELQEKVTDEERRRHRDSLSDEERRQLSAKSQDRTTQWILSGNKEPIESRLEQIEKRLEVLELKK